MQTSESEESPISLYVTLTHLVKLTQTWKKPVTIEQWYSTVEYPNMKNKLFINNRGAINELVY